MDADYVTQFLTYLEHERNVSPHTLRGYSRDICDFLAFMKAGDAFRPETVDSLAIRGFLADMRDRGASDCGVVGAAVAHEMRSYRGGAAAQRWQRGHQTLARWPMASWRSGVPHWRQASPPRP